MTGPQSRALWTAQALDDAQTDLAVVLGVLDVTSPKTAAQLAVICELPENRVRASLFLLREHGLAIAGWQAAPVFENAWSRTR